MWRTGAVITLLVEDVAGLEASRSPEDGSDDESAEPEVAALRKAARRARWVSTLDWLALLMLFLLRDTARPFLPWGATIETVFTLGALAIAAHAGFRWAQLQRYLTVARLCAELRARDAG